MEANHRHVLQDRYLIALRSLGQQGMNDAPRHLRSCVSLENTPASAHTSSPQGWKEMSLEVNKAVRTFRDDCEQLITAMGLKRPPNTDEAWILQFYCKQILTKIEPYLPQQPQIG